MARAPFPASPDVNKTAAEAANRAASPDPNMVAAAAEHVALYATEDQIARRVLGRGKERQWRALATVWEGQGLPTIDPQTGARYWPAVKAWLDRRYCLRDDSPAAPDGVERPWTGPKQRRA